MRCSNTNFNVYLRQIVLILGQCSSTDEVLDIFYVNYCAVLERLPQFWVNFEK